MSWSKVRRLLLSKRAVDPIIATLLLIVMAVAAAAIAWVFISGILRPPTNPGIMPSASLTVESCSGSTGTAVLKLLNTGEASINITDLRVVDENAQTAISVTFTITVGNSTSTTLPVGPLSPGQNAHIVIQGGFVPGHVYRFVITITAAVPQGSSTDVVAQVTATQ